MIPALAHLDPVSLRCWQITCELMFLRVGFVYPEQWETDLTVQQLKNERAALIASLSELPVTDRRMNNEKNSTYDPDHATAFLQPR